MYIKWEGLIAVDNQMNMAVKLRLLLLISLVRVSLAIPREEFYTFGLEAGDSALPPNDDRSSGRINLQRGSFPYFDDVHTALFVSTQYKYMLHLH